MTDLERRLADMGASVSSVSRPTPPPDRLLQRARRRRQRKMAGIGALALVAAVGLGSGLLTATRQTPNRITTTAGETASAPTTTLEPPVVVTTASTVVDPPTTARPSPVFAHSCREPDPASRVADAVSSAGGTVWTSAGLGSLAFSTNAGSTWNWQCNAFPGAMHFRAVDADSTWAYAAEGQHELVAGEAWLYRTTDRGATWSRAKLPYPERLSIVAMAAVDRSTAWVLANSFGNQSPMLFRTTDGVHWTKVGLPKDVATGSDLSFVDAKNGCLAAWEQGLYVTSDGGQSWTHAPIPGAGLVRRVEQVDLRTGYVVADTESGDTTKVFATSDGGRTWTPGADALAVAATGATTAVAINSVAIDTDGLVVSLTEDSGSTWRSLPNLRASGYHEIIEADGLEVWVANGQNELLRSADGGHTWQRVALGLTP